MLGHSESNISTLIRLMFTPSSGHRQPLHHWGSLSDIIGSSRAKTQERKEGMNKKETHKMESDRVPSMMRLGVHIVSRAHCLLIMFRKTRMFRVMKPNTTPGAVPIISHLIFLRTQWCRYYYYHPHFTKEGNRHREVVWVAQDYTGKLRDQVKFSDPTTFPSTNPTAFCFCFD